jgi:hypothetical protein
MDMTAFILAPSDLVTKIALCSYQNRFRIKRSKGPKIVLDTHHAYANWFLYFSLTTIRTTQVLNGISTHPHDAFTESSSSQGPSI